MKNLKINIGCGWRNFGKEWTHIDLGDYDHLDHKCDISKRLPLDDNVADLIYASHVISYFDREEIKDILKEWKRVLIPGGILRLAVPDFNNMSNLYKDGKCNLYNLLGPLYGKMKINDSIIYHKTVYDFFTLFNLLETLEFKDIRRYNWKETDHAIYDDHSQAYIPHMDKKNGTLISLNIECQK